MVQEVSRLCVTAELVDHLVELYMSRIRAL
jgi:hypothetical protein